MWASWTEDTQAFRRVQNWADVAGGRCGAAPGSNCTLITYKNKWRNRNNSINETRMRDLSMVAGRGSNGDIITLVLCQSELETTRKAEASNPTRQRRNAAESYSAGTLSCRKTAFGAPTPRKGGVSRELDHSNWSGHDSAKTIVQAMRPHGHG